MSPRVVVISFDGAIASGKSTLLERLRVRLPYPVVIAREPVEQWEESGLLREMYESLARRNAQKTGTEAPDDGMPGMFQVYAFSTRLGEFAQRYREAERLVRETGSSVLLMTERSVYSDRAIFKHMLQTDGYITDVQSRVYEGCFEAWEMATERCRPDLAVWLDTPPDECLRRQKIRAREQETALFEEQDKDAEAYARALHNRHIEVFGDGQFEGAPVIKFDGLQAFHLDELSVINMAREITKRVGPNK